MDGSEKTLEELPWLRRYSNTVSFATFSKAINEADVIKTM